MAFSTRKSAKGLRGSHKTSKKYEYTRLVLLTADNIQLSPEGEVNSRPFSRSIQPLTAFAILSYGKRDFAEAEGRKTQIEERCMRRRRGGGRGKKFNAGPEGRNLAKETENQRGFAYIGK